MKRSQSGRRAGVLRSVEGYPVDEQRRDPAVDDLDLRKVGRQDMRARAEYTTERKILIRGRRVLCRDRVDCPQRMAVEVADKRRRLRAGRQL